MRPLLILNPVSGTTPIQEQQLPEIEQRLRAGNLFPEIVWTTPERSAADWARQAVGEGRELVIAGGGDGTVSEVARELAGTSRYLGILPLGTFNNIARSLGIGPDLASACQILVDQPRRAIDIGVANERHLFFEAAGVGLDATLFPLGEEIKGGRWSRIGALLQMVARYRPRPIIATFDRPVAEAITGEQRHRLPKRYEQRREIRLRATLAVAANGPYYGSGFTVAPGARLSDGRLTLTIYRGFTKLQLARHFWAIHRGQFRASPHIETFHAAEITLKSPGSLPVHVDGQPIGHLPVRLKALPGALHVVAPPSRRGVTSEVKPENRPESR